MTESAADRARRLWDGTADGTARAILDEIANNPEDIYVLQAWVADRVRAAMRSITRDAEGAVWPARAEIRKGRTVTEVRTQTGQLPSLDDIGRLLSLPVLAPVRGDGRQSILWKDMTVENHRARIGMLEKTLRGTQRTIDCHEWSIKEIQKYHARCLGDIPPEALKSDL